MQGPRQSQAWARRAVLGAALAIALSACGSSSGGASASSTGLTLYSAQHEQTTDALVAAFTKQTGIKVRVKSDDEDVLTAQIEQEGSRSPADLFFTENSNWLEQLGEKGMLSTVDSSTLANVPAQDSATSGDWVGVSARIAVLAYDATKVDASQLPMSVMGLADPQWKGKIELAPSETDFWPVVSSVAKAKGDAATVTWLKAIKANASNDNVPDNETLVRDVSAGTTQLALINHYYFYRLESEVKKGSVQAKIAYFAPGDPGYVEGISGAAILKSSKHQADAEKFLAFITSVAGQSVIARTASFEYPIHPGVAANPELTPLSQLQPNSFTPAELGTGLDAKKLLQEAGLL